MTKPVEVLRKSQSGNQMAAFGSSTLVESIREIYNCTAAPVKLTTTKELSTLGFTFVNAPYLQGHYSKFYRAKKNQEQIVMKTLQLDKLKSMHKNQTIDESCKILEYICKKEKVPFALWLFDQFLIDDTLYLFMFYYSQRSIHYKMRTVTIFKEGLICQWGRQLGSVIKFMLEKGIVHRSVRLEHLLLDQHENLYLTGFTRAIFALNPHNFQLNKCNREFPCRKRNHLPPEAFVGSKHSPLQIDEWSFGVILASLFTSRHPFNPKLITLIDFEQQWQEFFSKHGTKMNHNVVAVLNKLFVTQENERIHLNDILKIEFLTQPDKTKKKSPKKVSVKIKKLVRSSPNPSTAVPIEGNDHCGQTKKAKFERTQTSGSKKLSKAKTSQVISKSQKTECSYKTNGKSTKIVKSVVLVEKTVKRENAQKDENTSTMDQPIQSKLPGSSTSETLKSGSKSKEVEPNKNAKTVNKSSDNETFSKSSNLVKKDLTPL